MEVARDNEMQLQKVSEVPKNRENCTRTCVKDMHVYHAALFSEFIRALSL